MGMSDPTRGYRVAGESSEQWFVDAATARHAVAATLGLTAADIEASGRRVNVDPVVVRHDGARWRSIGVWLYRSASGTARLFEMVRIDEAMYDH
jgi:hypothetical protein